ncbi:MAG: hypothetical protein A3K10_07530 [Bacteroidetes bacterium RIFCSPLOWO2_12_FULL_31_6]|nr:MAG: hypothetical protein A3K10_07530 [Bacteroidetes bacterium RIFCSPLOWO2_12_FULL_31_6]
MNIDKHICDLLFRYECVIIPGFGGLITSHYSAIIRNDEHFLYPPSKFIAFNKNLNKQDGLLANYISEKEKITYSESVYKIDQFAKLITTQLQKGKKISLVNIGVFHTDKEKNILFTPDGQINYLTDSFGLSRLYATPIKSDSGTSSLNKHSSNGIVKRLFPSKVKSYHLAFAASVVLFASVWLPYNSKIESHQFDYSSLNSFDQIQKPVIKAEALFSEYNPFAKPDNNDSALKLNVHVAEFVSVNSKVDVNTPVVESKNITTSDGAPQEINTTTKSKSKLEEIKINTSSTNKQYYIIAGVFAQKENAEKMVRLLKQDGFKNSLIVDKNKKGHYRVAFDSYYEKGIAENSLNKIKLSHKKSAWLLSR